MGRIVSWRERIGEALIFSALVVFFAIGLLWPTPRTAELLAYVVTVYAVAVSPGEGEQVDNDLQGYQSYGYGDYYVTGYHGPGQWFTFDTKLRVKSLVNGALYGRDDDSATVWVPRNGEGTWHFRQPVYGPFNPGDMPIGQARLRVTATDNDQKKTATDDNIFSIVD